VVAEARREVVYLLAGFPHCALDRPGGQLAAILPRQQSQVMSVSGDLGRAFRDERGWNRDRCLRDLGLEPNRGVLDFRVDDPPEELDVLDPQTACLTEPESSERAEQDRQAHAIGEQLVELPDLLRSRHVDALLSHPG
jgi:hypothetical protein